MSIGSAPTFRVAAALAVTAGLTFSGSFVPRSHAAATSTVYILSESDTNIEDLFRNTLVPDFQKAFPQYKVNYVNDLHGTNSQAQLDKLTAAMKAGKTTTTLDVWEATPSGGFTYPAGKTDADYFLPLNPSNVPNAAKVAAGVLKGQGAYAMPYRASAVGLAYNSQQVKNAPTTFSGLIAWIKANPGKFTYCAPDQGGSGDNFVNAAIHSVMSPADYKKLPNGYNKALEKDWPKAWALLKSIEPDLFQNGFHPKGNTPVLNLLAKGSITMATAWSDQALTALDKGLLPSYIKLAQINPPFPGGPTDLAVPKMSQNPAGARAFLNFILNPAEQGRIATAIEGFPAIQFKYEPASVIKHFGALAKNYDSIWPGGPYDQDVQTAWKANVPNS